ncbi:MAG: hypothetical protein IJ461_00945, partial [Clostridia bacterium]|nr:hypothetical protein [Clostridia bacterium]
MLLHLGGGFTVDSSRLVMFTDLSRPVTAATQTLVDKLHKQGRIRHLPGRAATLILCQQEGEVYGIYSPIG